MKIPQPNCPFAVVRPSSEYVWAEAAPEKRKREGGKI